MTDIDLSERRADEMESEEKGARPTEKGPQYDIYFWIRLTGYLFILSFFGLSETYLSLDVTFVTPFTNVAADELFFWIAHSALLVPGLLLVGYGTYEPIYSLLRRLGAAIERMSRRDLVLSAVALLFIATAAARVGNALVLSDYPITDDEYAVKFGGEILAQGKVKIPQPEFVNAIPTLYYFMRDGWMTSADWLGPQIAWAIGEVTGLGMFVWAFAAAIPVVFVGMIVGRRLGAAWGAVAAAIFLLSPMAFSLSLTTHAHLLSRAFLAVALWLYLRAEESGSTRAWAVTGLAFGVSFICRPPETAFLALPFVLALVIRAIQRSPGAINALGAMVAGGLVPVAVFVGHAWLVTGTFLPPRLIPGGLITVEVQRGGLWFRFGANSGFNLLMLAIYFLGPLGIALSLVGVWVDRFTRLLGLSVVSMLALGLFHHNTGIHIVGPIHYSECAIPLAILAAHGIERFRSWLAEHRLNVAGALSALAVAILVGSLVFNSIHLLGMRAQAAIQEDIYTHIEAAAPADQKSIVLAPHFGNIWRTFPKYADTGSWVFVWRRPRPDYSERVMILQDHPESIDAIRRAFPDRALFRLVRIREEPYLVLQPIADGTPSR